MAEKKELADVIVEVLQGVQYTGQKDIEKLKSAIHDLCGAFPKEQKFLLNNMDEDFLKICMRAKYAEESEIKTVAGKAADHLIKERMVDAGWAHSISEQFVFGMWRFVHPEKEVANPEPKTEPKRESNQTKRPQSSLEPEPETIAQSRPSKKRRLFAVAAIGVIIIGVVGGVLYHNHKVQEELEYQAYLGKTYQDPDMPKPQISEHQIDMGKGGKRTLSVDNVHPGDSVTWESSDPSVVSVNADGKIHGKAKGAAIITAAVDNYDTELECTVSVNKLHIVDDDGDTLGEYGLDEGSSYTLMVDGTDSRDVKWSSSNEDILEVSGSGDGTAEVNVVGCGVAKITAKVDGQTLKVKPEIWMSDTDKIVLQTDEITVTDKKKIWVAYDSQIWCYNHNTDIAEGTWLEKRCGSCAYLEIEKHGTGTTTIDIYAGDENDNRDTNVKMRTITVTCY